MEETKGFVDIGLVGFTDKGEYNPESIYMMNDIVHRDNGLWRCLIDHTTGIEPEENHNWTIFIQSTKELRGITAIDTKGILGPEGETVSAQELAEKLSAPEFEDFSQEGATVPGARTAISQILSGIPVPKIFSKIKAALMGLVTLGEIQAYLVNNGLCTEAGKYFLDAAYGKTLKEAIDSTNSNLAVIQSAFTPSPGINVYYNNSIYKFGRVVCYNFQTSAVSLTSGQVIANVPIGFRPITTAIGIATQENGEPIAYNISTDGDVLLYGNINNKLIIISGSYIIWE